MNKQNTILLIGVILIVGYLYFFNKKNTLENFTQEEQDLAQVLLDKFNKNEIPTFTKYMNILLENKNTSDNLISKGVYNKLSKKEGLVIEDILDEMKDE